MNLDWDENLATGIDSIDDQHKELFLRMNKVLLLMKEGVKKEEVIKALISLEEHLIQHFEEEEALQIKNNYPKYNLQHEDHEKFKNEIKELRKVFETSGVSALFVINMQHKMVRWWRQHISDLDKELGEFLLKR